MTRDETITLLKLVVAGDRRTIGPEDIAYWAAMLAATDLDRAVSALVMIRRREPDKWVDPGHIWGMCNAKTDGAAAGAGLADCDHGRICADCRLVHRPDEPCDVLVAAGWPRALGSVTRPIPAEGAPTAEPPAPSPDDLEVERVRQQTHLAALIAAETTTTEEAP